MSMDISELLNKIIKLDNTLTTLNNTITTLSSKMTTPENMDLSVSAYSTKYRFYDVAESFGAVGTNLQSLAQSAVNIWFTLDTDDRKVYDYNYPLGDRGWSLYYDASGMAGDPFLAWDWTNSQLYIMDDAELRVVTGNGSGTLSSSATLSHPSWAVGAWTTKAIAHDETNDVVYAILYNSTTTVLQYIQVNVSTGVMSSPYEIPEHYNDIIDAEIVDESLYLLDDTNKLVLAFRLGQTSPYIVISSPPVYATGFSVEKDTYLWSWIDADPAHVKWRGLSFVQRTSVEDIARATTMTYGATIINAVTATTIVSADKNRECIEIFNSDTTDIVYLGDDASVTNLNGLPLYPLTSIQFDGYTGGIIGYSTAASSVRYIELK
jgi:hypothetical protein